jgi:hypothetical protein
MPEAAGKRRREKPSFFLSPPFHPFFRHRSAKPCQAFLWISTIPVENSMDNRHHAKPANGHRQWLKFSQVKAKDFPVFCGAYKADLRAPKHRTPSHKPPSTP